MKNSHGNSLLNKLISKYNLESKHSKGITLIHVSIPGMGDSLLVIIHGGPTVL